MPQTSASIAEPTAAQWREFARQDVLAAYGLYVENHPGMHDPTNPGFSKQLEQARDAALSEVGRVNDRAGYARALGAFTAVLSDGHARIEAKKIEGAAASKELWPGFIAAWRGGRMLVHQVAAGAPVPVGAQVLSCEGKPIEDVVKAQLLTTGFRPKDAGHWWGRSPGIFVANADSDAVLKSCTFLLPDGKKQEVKLAWSEVPSNFPDRIQRATDGERTPVGLGEPRPGIFHIGLQNFQPDDATVKTYRALFETLRARKSELAKARAIVLDLRYNNGGSSTWPYEAAQALWGDEVVEQIMEDYHKDVRIWWRASDDNIAYMAKMEEGIRRNGNVEFAEDVRRSAEGMKASRAKGEPYYITGEEKAAKTPPKQPAKSDLSTPVYVITPGRCASACLDALDIFTRFPNVRLIGAPTSSDTTYMEVRFQDLPSGKGRIIIPNKLWAGRPRASGEIYRPHILVEDLDWSTATFLNRIEADLSARR